MNDLLRSKAAGKPFLVLIVFCFVATAPSLVQARKYETVKLEISDAGTLVMKSESKCPMKTGRKPRPEFPEKGCIRAPEGEALEVEFTLSGTKSNDACKKPQEYKLDGIQLGGKNGLKPTTAQWDNPTTLLDDEVQADFSVDSGSGWANFSTNANGNIVLENNNESEDGYFFWYRVRATCSNPETPNTLYYDPRGDNEGAPN